MCRTTSPVLWELGEGDLPRLPDRSGVFMARATTVVIVSDDCAWDEPEPLAHKLPTLLMTIDLLRPFSCLCNSVGGGA